MLQQVAPSAEDDPRQGRQPGGVSLRIDGCGQLANIAAVGIIGAPVLDHRGRHLEVKLKPVDAGAGAECLVAARLGRSQPLRARRQIECLAVPVEDGLGRAKTRE